MGRSGAVVVVAMVWCLAAQAAPAADVRIDAAREHYLQGDKLFKQEKYANALHEYEQAYLAKPDPSFLYSIAQCHRLLGNRVEALRFYRRYLDDAPFAPNREVVEKYIKDLEAKPAAASSKPVAAPPAVAAAPPKPAAAPTVVAAAPSAPPPPPAPSARPPAAAASAPLRPAASSAPPPLVAAPAPPPPTTAPAPPPAAAPAPPPAAVPAAPLAAAPAAPPPAAAVQPLPAAAPSSPAAMPPATDGAPVVQIAAGPSEPRPLYKRWWFWTGVGVVVLGGIALALAIKQQDPSCPAGRTCQ